MQLNGLVYRQTSLRKSTQNSFRAIVVSPILVVFFCKKKKQNKKEALTNAANRIVKFWPGKKAAEKSHAFVHDDHDNNLEILYGPDTDVSLDVYLLPLF